MGWRKRERQSILQKHISRPPQLHCNSMHSASPQISIFITRTTTQPWQKKLSCQLCSVCLSQTRSRMLRLLRFSSGFPRLFMGEDAHAQIYHIMHNNNTPTQQHTLIPQHYKIRLVQRGQLKEGDWLLVTGAGGGMGAAAVQLGKVRYSRLASSLGSPFIH